MIGTNLNLSLPLLSDNLATIVAKTSAALSSIQTSIADKATPTALDITSALSFQGNWATNVGGLILVSGNPPTAAGSVYYSGNEFYMVDATGAIKMTLNGAINVAGIGAIGGDYGGTNPALLSYDTASAQYRFYSNGGTLAFADTSSRAVVLNGTSGTTKLAVSNSQVTNYTLTMPIAVPASTRPLLMASTGALSTTASDTVVVPNAACVAYPEADWVRGSGEVTCTATSGVNVYFPLVAPVGAVITGYTVYLNKTSDNTHTFSSSLIVTDQANSPVSNTPGTGTEASIANNPGAISLLKTGLAITVASNNSQWVRVSRDGASAGDQVFFLTYTVK